MGGKSTKTTSENKPPAWAKPLFEQSASEAQNLYNSGSGGNVYYGQTVADLSPTTQGGINALTDAGRQNFADYGAMAAQASGPSAASNYLTDYASGKYLAEGNPYYKERLQNEIGDMQAQVQSQFSGSGRYGSGANTGVLAKNTGNMLLQGLENDFNRQQANQFAAVNAIDGANAQSIANQINVGNAGQQAAFNGANAQLQAGQLLDQKQQRDLMAEYARWQAEDMKDWTRLGLLQSAAAGSAGNYGTNVQTQSQPFNAMAGVGALGQLFMKSDARLKEHVVPVSVVNGHVLWEYAYKGRPERHRGVMAQQIAETRPDAVAIMPDGYLAVDYEALGLKMERVQ